MNRLLTISLLLFSVLTLRAQVTLEQCQEWAQQNYPLIHQYGLIKKTADYSLSNASRSWIPQVSLAAQFSYQSAVTGFPDDMLDIYEKMGVSIKGLSHEQYKVGVNLNQKIWDGGASGVERHAAKSLEEVQAAQNDVGMYALRQRINNLFFGCLLLDEQLRQNENLQNQLRSNIAVLDAYLQNGVAMPYDVAMMQAELLTAQQQQTQIESSRDAYRTMLAVMTAYPIDALVAPQEEVVDVATINRPELEHINKQWLQLMVNEKGIRSASNPYIGAFAEGFYGNPGLNLFKSMFEDKWTWNFVGGIKIQWNISSFYTRKNDLNKIKLAQDQLAVQRDMFLYNNRLEVIEQQRAIVRMRRLLEQDAKIVELRATVRSAYEAKLRSGVIEVNDLLKEITNENQARIAEAMHRVELLQSLYNLKYTVNN